MFDTKSLRPEEGLHEIHRSQQKPHFFPSPHCLGGSYTVWKTGVPHQFYHHFGWNPNFFSQQCHIFLGETIWRLGYPNSWMVHDGHSYEWMIWECPPIEGNLHIFCRWNRQVLYLLCSLGQPFSCSRDPSVSAGGAAARHCEPWSQEGRALLMDRMDQWYNQPEVGVSIIMGVPPKNEWFISRKIPSRNGTATGVK